MAIKFSQLDAPATQSGFSELVGIKRQTVADWVEKGQLEKGGTYRDWLLAYCERLRTQAAGRGMSGSGDYETEKLRLTKAQADETEHKARKAELEVKLLEATLIRAEDAIRVWGNMIAAARAKFLSIPSKGASLVRAADSQIEAEDILRGLVYEGLQELAELEAQDYAAGGSAPSGDNESESDVGTAPEPDRDRVGRQPTKAKSRGQRRTRSVQ